MTTSDYERMMVELSEFQRSRYFGKYRGLVRDVDDPDNLGRLVAQVPEVYGQEDSPWAWPAVPFAGASHGLVLLPEVGTASGSSLKLGISLGPSGLAAGGPGANCLTPAAPKLAP
ncbi:hypothetical protein XM38_039890 [Halomicronema hongdechloris C2206]|uniref:Gp5/Type VI secretion system Vgr protein OB-fold domain-containing protein n=1 Tax=Halomicronema hongdechloris C2206 TaxID=1641165 RepID=A0A1Z3HSC4_9CYAN|nr:hypothetical protein XM38_039890 [Halomicronema hongdechloris C2206]